MSLESYQIVTTLSADQSPVTLLVTDKEENLLGYSDQRYFWVYSLKSNFQQHLVLSFQLINCAFLYFD